jgi:CspA family cold shock protein
MAHIRQRREAVEAQPDPDRVLGKIARVFPLKGFGFLKDENGEEYFFHRSEVLSGGPFDDLQEGWRVQFVKGQGPKGLRASEVTVQRP